MATDSPTDVALGEPGADAVQVSPGGGGGEAYTGPLKLVHDKLEFNLKNQTIKIGRNAQNDVQLPDQLVSGSHAMIRNGKLIDKGSTNGTFVNGQEVPKNQYWALRPKDDITFGDTTLKVLAGYPYRSENDAAPMQMGLDDDSSSGDNDSGDDDDAPPPGLVHSKLKHAATKHWVTDVNTGAPSQVDPAKRPANDVNHQVRVLQKQVDTLRFENQKLKGQLNPQRQRQIKKREQEAQKALHNQIRNLEFQLMYGEEKTEDLNKELQEEVDRLKHENKLAKKDQEELVRIRRRLEEQTEAYEALTEEEQKSRTRIEELYKAVQKGPRRGGGGSNDEVMAEIQGMKGSVQKLFLTVFLFVSVILICLGLGVASQQGMRLPANFTF